MNEDEIIRRIQFFRERFIVRSDVYAIQLPDDFVSYTMNVPRKKGYFRHSQELTDEVLRLHLKGKMSIGVYNLNLDDKVKWVCLDYDGKASIDDDRDATVAMAHAMEGMELIKEKFPFYKDAMMVESSGRGTHIWILFEKLISAAVAKAIGTDIIKAQDVLAEAFPKQTTIGESGYGNLVKLPFGINKANGKWSEMLFPRSMSEIKPVTLPPSMEEYYAPKVQYKTPREVGRPCWNAIMDTGFAKGSRNNTAFKLALFLKLKIGLPREMATGAMLAWNQSNNPPMDMGELRQVVDSTYSREYHLGCASIRDDSMLEKYCDAKECRIGRWVLEDAANRLPRETESDWMSWLEKFKGGEGSGDGR